MTRNSHCGLALLLASLSLAIVALTQFDLARRARRLGMDEARYWAVGAAAGGLALGGLVVWMIG